jgi:AraC-like DNA-binding protein
LAEGAMLGIKELVKLPSGSSFRVLQWDQNLREVVWVKDSHNVLRIDGEGMHWHYHQALELTLFTSGRGTRFVGDQIEGFEAGEIVLLGENLPHYWHTRGNSSGLSVQFFFPPAHPFWAFPETAPLAAHCQAAVRGIHYYGKTANRLITLLHQLAAADGLERLGVLMQLLAVASMTPETERELISTQTFSLSAESDHQNAMRTAVRYLLNNYRDEIHLGQLLEVTRMSKPTFCRYFKKHSGKTLGRFLQQIRVEAACRELAETDKPIIEIALASGFSQISFFNRVFRRLVKCTPSGYRERHHKKRV